MVSIRRRKLLGLCSGRSSCLDPFSRVYESGQSSEIQEGDTKPVSVHPLPWNNGFTPKEETTSVTVHGSPDFSGCSPLKESLLQKFPEVKRRKRHRRKHAENQEACTKRGVYFKNKKWQAAIKVDKKQIHLGTVGSEEEAARLYDRAAFMCGREPNFELSEEEKQELLKYKWDEFLSITRSAIMNKKGQRSSRAGLGRKPQNDDLEVDQRRSSFSASEDDMAEA